MSHTIDAKDGDKVETTSRYGPPPFDVWEDLKTIWREWRKLQEWHKSQAKVPGPEAGQAGSAFKKNLTP